MSRSISIKFPNSLAELATLFDKLQRSASNIVQSGATLAIKAGGSAIVKNTATVYYYIDSALYKLAASDMAALVGTVTNAKFNVFVFTVNASGTLATYMGTEASALSGIVFPTVPNGEVSLGYIIVNPTGTGNFVGGTTALDDATVVPNVVYINTSAVYQVSLSVI